MQNSSGGCASYEPTRGSPLLEHLNAAEVRMPRVTAFDVELLFIARQHDHEIAVIPVTWHYGEHSKVNPVTDTLQNLRDVLTVRLFGWMGKYA